jgi:CheY-like chemotaxis protein
MPRLTGIEVLKTLRSKTELAEIPVVLFSTSTQPSEVSLARKFNAGFVTKPIISSQVQQIVNDLLSHCNEEVRQRLKRK